MKHKRGFMSFFSSKPSTAVQHNYTQGKSQNSYNGLQSLWTPLSPLWLISSCFPLFLLKRSSHTDIYFFFFKPHQAHSHLKDFTLARPPALKIHSHHIPAWLPTPSPQVFTQIYLFYETYHNHLFKIESFPSSRSLILIMIFYFSLWHFSP